MTLFPDTRRIEVELFDFGPDLLQAGRIGLERFEHHHLVAQLHLKVPGIDDLLGNRDLVFRSQLGQHIPISLLCDYKEIAPTAFPVVKTFP